MIHPKERMELTVVNDVEQDADSGLDADHSLSSHEVASKLGSHPTVPVPGSGGLGTVAGVPEVITK